MTKGRLEAFSDGVLAIIITIMVLEVKAPHGGSLKDLLPLIPVFCSYILSFIYVGIYWNNHHNMFHAVQHVNGRVLWANLHLLFWLSLIPVVTAWMGEHVHESWPLAAYGVVLMACAIAYYILTKALMSMPGKNAEFVKNLGNDFKGKISVVMYAAAIALSFWAHWLSYVLYIAVAALWFIPDKRFER
ncbi:TMEM175 family protein [Bdellovibrio sp. 22V]|uniref:TMEM175 family protein n=1 Tax=Bdellovibrio TaxID=958 RepID=UPI00254366F0|nr:TMEM175 family protein [Bdellovibrio sp. 22V]WII72936.1 TMEM175 family protein [Bdellovibrio sp. 22V]